MLNAEIKPYDEDTTCSCRSPTVPALPPRAFPRQPRPHERSTHGGGYDQERWPELTGSQVV